MLSLHKQLFILNRSLIIDKNSTSILWIIQLLPHKKSTIITFQYFFF